MKSLTLRKLNNSDIVLLTEWLNKDYIARWYHDTNAWLQEINGRNGDYNWIHHFIAADGETPVGFCQYYDCYDAGDMEDWYEVSRRGETFSIDYLIGHACYLGKGYGKSLVQLLTDAVLQEEHAQRIIVQPDAENHASVRVLTANGYVYDERGKFYCKSFK